LRKPENKENNADIWGQSQGEGEWLVHLQIGQVANVADTEEGWGRVEDEAREARKSEMGQTRQCSANHSKDL
jgi:hypothetical protein